MNDLNFFAYRFQYRTNKKGVNSGDEITHSTEIHLSADRCFFKPGEIEPEPDSNGGYLVDLSEDGSGINVGVHHVILKESHAYDEDYRINFFTKCDDGNTKKKPYGLLDKKCHVKDGTSGVFEISELILQRAIDNLYRLELSLICDPVDEEIYEVEAVEVSGNTVIVHIISGGEIRDIEHKECNNLINLENTVEIIAVLDGTPLDLGYVQIREEE